MSPPFENFTFSSRVWNLLLNTESGSLLFDERRTKRERERESFIASACCPSIDRASILLVREKSASLLSRPIAPGKSIEERSNHIERERERERRSHTHNQSSWRQKSSA